VDNAELIEPRDRAAWRRWLARHHARETGVWLAIHKRSSATGTFDYEQAVLEALCFGWIDSTRTLLDDDRSRIWMSPRRPGSGWSASNKARIVQLETEGALAAPGLAAIDRAKADGSWTALDRVERLEVPDDLSEAFTRHDGSRANWDGFPPSVRKQILGWIYSAKREATRATRVEETATLAARGERVQQWRPKA
jgi:uncharacterized protein YdeI (YjbR/CyaY-like superfamily)